MSPAPIAASVIPDEKRANLKRKLQHLRVSAEIMSARAQHESGGASGAGSHQHLKSKAEEACIGVSTGATVQTSGTQLAWGETPFNHGGHSRPHHILCRRVAGARPKTMISMV